MEKAKENLDENEIKVNDANQDVNEENEIKKNDTNQAVNDENQIEKDELEEEEDLDCEEDSPQEKNEPEVMTLEEQMKILNSHKKMLKDENAKLTNELEALKDRLARTLAEYDNYRKRTIKEKEAIYTDACGDIFKSIFPILDNLERASVVQGNIEDIKKGVDMTLQAFNDALEKLQIEEIDASGEFNPNVHNAVMHVEDQESGPNQVVEVLQKGYKKGEKVLRYSMVKVAN